MYAVAKIDPNLSDTVAPGVIFTLRQVKGKEEAKEQNPLFPYYMVYITDDGEVMLSFLHAKKILDYYKKLCSGKKDVLKDLVEKFNKETNDGREMVHYSDLLEGSIESIVGKKQDIGVASLFSKGGTTTPKSIFDGVEDFELVTFLVLKS